jgi:hypothetical protein
MTTLYMLTEGQGVLSEFSVVNGGETHHAYRTPVLAVLMEPLFNFQDPHLFEVEGQVLKPDAVGATCSSLRIVKKIPLPKITTGERMKIAASCASWATGIGEIIFEQSKRLESTLNGLLTEWSQRYKWNGQQSSDVDLTQWSQKCGWTVEETAAIERKIELQTALCGQGAQEAARANVLVKKITWALGNAMNALGLCLPAEVARWTAKTLLAIIELPILLPEISEILDKFVEDVMPRSKKSVKKVTEELLWKKQFSRSSFSKLEPAAAGSGTMRSKRSRVPPVRTTKGMQAD